MTNSELSEATFQVPCVSHSARASVISHCTFMNGSSSVGFHAPGATASGERGVGSGALHGEA